jgi:hypothetical protein
VKNKVAKQLKKEDKREIRKQLKAAKKSVKLGKKVAKLFVKFNKALKRLELMSEPVFVEKANTKKTSINWVVSTLTGLNKKYAKKTTTKGTKKVA